MSLEVETVYRCDKVKYYKEVDEFVFTCSQCNKKIGVSSEAIFPKEIIEAIGPEKFLDALDEILLLKIKQLKLHKITKMTEYIARHERLAEEARNATTRLELAKLNTEKLLLKEIRHAVKLMEMEEKAIKTEMLERQVK